MFDYWVAKQQKQSSEDYGTVGAAGTCREIWIYNLLAPTVICELLYRWKNYYCIAN
jgi:hypothetical protein